MSYQAKTCCLVEIGSSYAGGVEIHEWNPETKAAICNQPSGRTYKGHSVFWRYLGDGTVTCKNCEKRRIFAT